MFRRTESHPPFGVTKWFAWHRVPIAAGKTAWLRWVERSIIVWSGSYAFYIYAEPGTFQRNKEAFDASATQDMRGNEK